MSRYVGRNVTCFLAAAPNVNEKKVRRTRQTQKKKKKNAPSRGERNAFSELKNVKVSTWPREGRESAAFSAPIDVGRVRVLGRAARDY